MVDFVRAFFNNLGDGNKPRLGCRIEAAFAESRIASVPEFIRAAGRDYTIRRSPAYVEVMGQTRLVPGQFHLVRSSDNSVVSSHTVTGQYDPLSLVDIAEEVQPFADQGWATPDGVYDVRDGQLEVLSLRLDAGALEVPKSDDASEMLHYLVIVNPHGLGRAQGKLITFRIVCANTFAAAVSAGYDFMVTHKVRDGVVGITRSRFEYAVSTWKKLQEHIAGLSKRINRFIAVPVNVDKALMLSNALLDIKSDDDASTRRKNQRTAIMDGFNAPSAGTFGRTSWDWLNAVTSYTSNGTADSKVDLLARLTRNIESTGSGFTLELKAVKLVEELAGV